MKTVVFLGLMLFLSSCGNGYDQGFEEYNPDNYSGYEEDPVESPPNFYGKPVIFRCEPADCVNGQAFLLTKKYLGASACSATLISENTILTNAHCVPDESKASCEEAEIFLPEIKDANGMILHAAARRTCSSIIKISAPRKNSFSQDFALLALDRPILGRPMGIVARSGMNDGETLEYHASMVSSYEGKYYVRSTKNTCQTVMNSLVFPAYGDSHDPVATVSGCKPIPGNSGSSLANKDGKIVGLIQAGYVDTAELRKSFNKFAKEIYEFPVPATNLSCVDLNDDIPSVDLELCALKIAEVKNSKSSDLLIKAADSKIGKVNDGDSASNFEWGWSLFDGKKEKEFLLLRIPTCMKNSRINAGDSSYWSRITGNKQIKYFNVPIQTLRFDSRLKMIFKEFQNVRPDLTIKFSDSGENFKAELTLVYENLGGLSGDFKTTVDLTRCNAGH